MVERCEVTWWSASFLDVATVVRPAFGRSLSALCVMGSLVGFLSFSSLLYGDFVGGVR